MASSEHNSDMIIVVDDAKKEMQFLESFMTYRVTTTIQKPNSPTEVFEVRRRYNDFEWLHSKLEETLPGCIVPPLPDKNSLTQLDKFDRDFVALRQAALQKFLRRVTSHPQMRLAYDVRTFLSAKGWELDSYKKAHPNSNTLFAKMGAQVKQLSERAASVQVSRTGVSFTERSSSAPNDQLNRFHELAAVSKERLHAFVGQLTSATNDEQAFANEQAELASLFTQCGNNEDTTRPAIVACSTALSASVKHIQDRIDLMRTTVIPAIHEYENFAESVKLALRNVDNLDAEQKRIVAQIERGVNAQKHAQLEDEVRRTKQKMETITGELQVDLQRWSSERDDDLRCAFAALAEAHMRQCEASIAEWEAAIQPIQHIADPPKLTNGD